MSYNFEESENWDLEIKPQTGFLEINFKEIWRYRDLLLMLVKRDFISFYKQTILGPIWFFIQPLLTTLMYMLIFGSIAKLSTDGLPAILFYLSGVTCWNYFSESFSKTSETFISNANIFGKVYFPRIIIPLSVILSNLIRFFIQMMLFLAVWAFYLFRTSQLAPNIYILLLPVLILLMAALGLGMGIIFSSLTTKYRDLKFLLSFGIQLMMFATPVIYPLSSMNEKFRWIIELNPITAIIETFRFAFMGVGAFSWPMLAYSGACTLVILSIGVLLFNKVEKTFMDTV